MGEIRVTGPSTDRQETILTREALDFVAELQRNVGAAREDLLGRRAQRIEDVFDERERDLAFA